MNVGIGTQYDKGISYREKKRVGEGIKLLGNIQFWAISTVLSCVAGIYIFRDIQLFNTDVAYLNIISSVFPIIFGIGSALCIQLIQKYSIWLGCWKSKYYFVITGLSAILTIGGSLIFLKITNDIKDIKRAKVVILQKKISTLESSIKQDSTDIESERNLIDTQLVRRGRVSQQSLDSRRNMRDDKKRAEAELSVQRTIMGELIEKTGVLITVPIKWGMIFTVFQELSMIFCLILGIKLTRTESGQLQQRVADVEMAMDNIEIICTSLSHYLNKGCSPDHLKSLCSPAQIGRIFIEVNAGNAPPLEIVQLLRSNPEKKNTQIRRSLPPPSPEKSAQERGVLKRIGDIFQRPGVVTTHSGMSDKEIQQGFLPRQNSPGGNGKVMQKVKKKRIDFEPGNEPENELGSEHGNEHETVKTNEPESELGNEHEHELETKKKFLLKRPSDAQYSGKKKHCSGSLDGGQQWQQKAGKGRQKKADKTEKKIIMTFNKLGGSYHHGMSAEIAKKLKLTPQHVGRILKKRGLNGNG